MLATLKARAPEPSKESASGLTTNCGTGTFSVTESDSDGDSVVDGPANEGNVGAYKGIHASG